MKTNNITKNGLLIILSGSSVGLSVIIHLLHRQFHFLDTYLVLNGIGSLSSGMTVLTNVFLVIPIVLFLGGFYLFRVNKEHPWIPLVLTLTLTFSSISMIAGGNGLVEYHFSIFMVTAIIGSFASIRLVITSLIIFAVHHFGGFLFFPELLCGTENYSFLLLMLHVVFLIFTSMATMLIIYINKTIEHRFEAEKLLHEEKLDGLLAEINRTSGVMVDDVNVLTEGSSQSAAASEEITTVLQQSSRAAESQLVNLQEGVHNNRLIVEQVEQIYASAKVVTDSVLKSLEEAEVGRKTVQEVADQMGIITNTVGAIKYLVEDLENKSSEVGNLLQVITKISDQTKLLALNASIEAARAGEEGKGFSIVAEEVRNLANGTEQSASEIQLVVSDIQAQINEVAEEMANGMEEIYKGNEKIEESEIAFGSIHDAALETEKEIGGVSEATMILLKQSNHTNDLFKEITVSVHESFENLEGISAASEQQSATTESLNDTTMSLNNLAIKLNQLAEEADQS